MSSAFDEHCAPAPGARVHTLRMRPGLGDCAPSGRIRLDALARWLQDVAYADVADAGLAAHAVWVVRRTRITVAGWPRFAEWCAVSTFCTGIGRMWAQRRTTIRPCPGDGGGGVGGGDGGGGQPRASAGGNVESSGPAPGRVEASALWVHLDPHSRRPIRFAPEELAAYAPAPEALAGRLSAKLRHPTAPDIGAKSGQWTFRAVDCDIAGHVNNAAYWQPLEEELLASAMEPPRFDAEMEFRAGAQPGKKLLLADSSMRWLLGPDGELLASTRLLP